jgi:hypothetical protein
MRWNVRCERQAEREVDCRRVSCVSFVAALEWSEAWSPEGRAVLCLQVPVVVKVAMTPYQSVLYRCARCPHAAVPLPPALQLFEKPHAPGEAPACTTL